MNFWVVLHSDSFYVVHGTVQGGQLTFRINKGSKPVGEVISLQEELATPVKVELTGQATQEVLVDFAKRRLGARIGQLPVRFQLITFKIEE